MKSKRVNLCVVGAGYWGINHIKTIKELNYLGGVVDGNRSTINSLKKKFPHIPIFKELRDAIESDLFDGFIIATPAETHFKLAKEILNNNYPVLVEKPFTSNLREANELINLANKKKICLMVGHLLLFHKAVSYLKNAIEKNKDWQTAIYLQ